MSDVKFDRKYHSLHVDRHPTEQFPQCYGDMFSGETTAMAISPDNSFIIVAVYSCFMTHSSVVHKYRIKRPDHSDLFDDIRMDLRLNNQLSNRNSNGNHSIVSDNSSESSSSSSSSSSASSSTVSTLDLKHDCVIHTDKERITCVDISHDCRYIICGTQLGIVKILIHQYPNHQKQHHHPSMSQHHYVIHHRSFGTDLDITRIKFHKRNPYHILIADEINKQMETWNWNQYIQLVDCWNIHTDWQFLRTFLDWGNPPELSLPSLNSDETVNINNNTQNHDLDHHPHTQQSSCVVHSDDQSSSNNQITNCISQTMKRLLSKLRLRSSASSSSFSASGIVDNQRDSRENVADHKDDDSSNSITQENDAIPYLLNLRQKITNSVYISGDMNCNRTAIALGTQSGRIELWNRECTVFNAGFRAHHKRVADLSAHPKYWNVIASVGSDWLCKLWDIQKLTCLYRFHGHCGRVECVEFSPSGDQLFTGAQDGILRVWNTSTELTLYTVSLICDHWAKEIQLQKEEEFIVPIDLFPIVYRFSS